MNRVIENTYRVRNNLVLNKLFPSVYERENEKVYVPRNAKLLAWGIFLIFFIDNGTLGLFPSRFFAVYRNVRLSDLLIYMLILYSFFHTNEMRDVLRSKALFIPKLLFWYYAVQFIASVLIYNTNLVEYFFRLKILWASFLVFPYLLLLKRGGLNYLIKIFFPVSVVANILYILTALSGVAFLPDVSIVKQQLPGGLEVYRVYGGTFFGESFFLGFVFLMLTKRFRLIYLLPAILFIIPHILAFGRGAWVGFAFFIAIMFVWNLSKHRNMRTFIRQSAMIIVFLAGVVYSFITFIPGSDYYIESVGSRITQGQQDFKYQEGTYGTRIANVNILVDLWLNSNILFGVGMHPFWVVKPETAEESIYMWGFSDLGWPAILAAYGLVGLLLVAAFQFHFIIITYKILKKTSEANIYIFFVLGFFTSLTTIIILSYKYYLFMLGIYGLGFLTSFSVAVTAYVENLLNKNSNK